MPGQWPRPDENNDTMLQIGKDLEIVLALFQEAGYPNNLPEAKKGR